ILNTTDQDFKNAWYEMELNPEAEPFIASGIIKYSSSDRFYVTTAEKARGDVIGGLPKVTGFDHEWDTLLTTSEDLMEFYNQGSDGIYNALQSITVRVYWDGGSQEEI